jgi:5-methylthioribose kinase
MAVISCPSVHPDESLVVIMQVKEVGDGNINYVYILEGPAGSLCLKQGHPYVRIMKSWKLTQVRFPAARVLQTLTQNCI